MTLYWVPNRGYVDDQEGDIPFYGSLPLPDGSEITWGEAGVRQVPTYTNRYQFPGEDASVSFQWEPGAAIPQMPYTPPGYIQTLLETADAAEAGQLKDSERQQWEEMRAQALSVPTRDLSRLTSAATGGYWGGVPEDPGEAAWWLSQGSPDLGAIMLGLRDKIRSGSATDAERTMFDEVRRADAYQNWVASVPQPSDAFSPLGDQFFQALAAFTGAVGGAGAFGAFAPVAGAAAGGTAAASAAAPSILGIPTSTLSTLGAIGSYGGMGANVLGGITGQDWLQKLGLGLGVAGGLAGGLAGLGNVFSTGINTVGDAARLAGSAGKLTGALGRATGVTPLQQASRYLGLGSQLGGVTNLLSAAQGVQAGATQALTGTGGRMAWDDLGSQDWLNWSGDMGGVLAANATPDIDWGAFTAGGPGSWYGQEVTDWRNGSGGGGGSWLGSALGALGSVGGFLGKNASWLGPAVSGLTSLGAGALGANAASDAAALQSQYLNRGLDLQTAQWLQQQANQAPWMEAGRSALGQLQGLTTQQAPTLQQMGPPSASAYGLPGATPGWRPGTYAGYTPTDIPSAAGYRYTPGQVPGAAQFRYTPGAVPTLSGAELLANDPGVAFRQSEARKALEASAAARGGLLSGSTLAALQRQGQDLASQEYGQAWNRASQQAQLREQWGQAASQLGWSQAESEARLREQLSQLASSQNWQQALQEAQQRAQQGQFGWQAGFQAQQQGQREAQQYDTDLYTRLMAQNQLQWGRDWQERQQYNDLWLQQYNAAMQQQATQFNRLATLANIGQVSTGQLGQLGQANTQQMNSLLGQLGSAQGLGALGPALSWQQGLSGLSGGIANLLKGLNV